MLFTIKYLVIIQQGEKYKVYGGGAIKHYKFLELWTQLADY